MYFSAEDGLAETAHVFLGGNNLPQDWQGTKRFVIGETGFGTGLNFLATWKLFEETATLAQGLDFISFEKYPLPAAKIARYLQPYEAGFDGRLQRLLSGYPPLIPGFHRIMLSPQVSLTLIFDDVTEALPKLQATVDAWFLDGFKPAANPHMWSPMVFDNMARLSHKGTSLATYTAAGQVRRDLIAAGFTIEKVPGYGRKRHMTIGRYAGATP